MKKLLTCLAIVVLAGPGKAWAQPLNCATSAPHQAFDYWLGNWQPWFEGFYRRVDESTDTGTNS